MSSLRAGEQVLALSDSGRVVLSRVLLFLHRDAGLRARFLTVETEEGGRLSLTPSHLLFLAPNRTLDPARYQARFASRARPGHYVLALGQGSGVRPARIVSVAWTEGRGVYAPLTEHGTLFVDGVAASSYAVVEDHWLAHQAFSPLRLLMPLPLLGGRGQSHAHYPTDPTIGSKRTPAGSGSHGGLYSPHGWTVPPRLGRGGTGGDLVADDGQAVHWYASLLHALGRLLLDPESFHS